MTKFFLLPSFFFKSEGRVKMKCVVLFYQLLKTCPFYIKKEQREPEKLTTFSLTTIKIK